LYITFSDPTQTINKLEFQATVKMLAAGLRKVLKVGDHNVVLMFSENSVGGTHRGTRY
jgi:hypothetical protein